MRIMVINGPSVNMLGVREPEIYGKKTFADMLALIVKTAQEEDLDLQQFQSNHEGAIVDKIHECYYGADAIIINAAAYSHTSLAILDALKAVGKPAVEVHISDIDTREEFRKISYVSLYCKDRIIGKGFDGYLEAIDILTK